MDDIIPLMAEWDSEYCMDAPSKFHMRESYVIKSQVKHPDTPTYMEALSGKHTDEYYKATYDEINILTRRDTWDIVSRKSISDQNVLPGTWYFKYKNKPDWNIRKFKARYCDIRYVQKRLSPEPLNWYSPVLHCYTVRFVFIFNCIIGLKSQSIYFKNAFDKADIPSGEPVFIELSRDFNSDGGKCDVILMFNKSLYGKSKGAHLWYEKL